jgi:hypothetical protein
MRQTLLRAGLTLLVAWSLLLLLSVWLGRDYGQLLLPLFRWELDWLAPEMRTLLLEVRDVNHQAVFYWSMETRRIMDIGGQLLPGGLALNSSTLMGHALQHLVLIYSLLLAWPGVKLSNRLLLLLLGIPWLLLVELLDVPLVLYGSIQDLLLANMAPHKLDSDPFVQWMYVMNTGGRLALSVAAAVLALISLQGILSLKGRLLKSSFKSTG